MHYLMLDNTPIDVTPKHYELCNSPHLVQEFAKTGHLRPVLHFSQKLLSMHGFDNNEKMCENAVLWAILAKCLKCV